MGKGIDTSRDKRDVYDFLILFVDEGKHIITGTSVQENGSFVTFMEEDGSATIIATSQIKSIRQTVK